jgi:putrescine:ornithine antiporter
MVITVIAMLYSVYALYASGGSAVMGGMLVLGLTYVIWGFISNRFTSSPAAGTGA